MRALLLLLLLPTAAFAIVDMKSANYSESWTDLVVPGVGYDLRVNRTYNSRALFNGVFGFGWCSDYETRVEVTPEGNVRLTECGGGAEVIFTPKKFDTAKVDVTVRSIIAEVKRRRPELKADYLAGLEKELHGDDILREEFGRRLSLKGKVEDGVVYLANGRESETILMKNGVFRRTLADGTSQAFDPTSGHMTGMADKNQNYLKIAWNRDTLASVTDNMGRKLTFKFNDASKKVERVVGPNNLTASYVTKGEDLIEVTDTKGAKHKYAYDDVHNMRRVDFPDGSYKALTYNKDKDWVTSFRNRKGCVETYDYHESKDDPKNHFWSDVVKRCGEKTTNQSRYEFFHRMRPDGVGVYLYRVRTENNSAVTDIVYHELFGKPVSVLRDGVKTEYAYFENGLVKSKKEPGHLVAFEYKNTCNKVSQVTMQHLEAASDAKGERKPTQAASKAEKNVRTVKTSFQYDPGRCNLLGAANTEGQTVKLQYDKQGRISQIEDQSKKLVKIKYESKFGKPSIVTRPGLGTIQVTYKGDGEIQKVESKEGPNVAVQVASIFNNLLDIISPATNDTPL